MKKRDILMKILVELGLPAIGLALELVQRILSGKQEDNAIREIVRDELEKAKQPKKKKAKYVEVKF